MKEIKLYNYRIKEIENSKNVVNIQHICPDYNKYELSKENENKKEDKFENLFARLFEEEESTKSKEAINEEGFSNLLKGSFST